MAAKELPSGHDIGTWVQYTSCGLTQFLDVHFALLLDRHVH